jgi:hypothetical protein
LVDVILLDLGFSKNDVGVVRAWVLEDLRVVDDE